MTGAESSQRLQAVHGGGMVVVLCARARVCVCVWVVCVCCVW